MFPDEALLSKEDLAFRLRKPSDYQKQNNVMGNLVLAPAEGVKSSAECKLRRTAMPSPMLWENDMFEMDGLDVLAPSRWPYIKTFAEYTDDDDDFGEEFLDTLAPKRFEDLTPVKKARILLCCVYCLLHCEFFNCKF